LLYSLRGRCKRPQQEDEALAQSLSSDAGARRAIVEAAASLRAENEALLASLVRHRSTLGNEQSCLARMEAAYDSLGLSPRRIPVDAESSRITRAFPRRSSAMRGHRRHRPLHSLATDHIG